MNASSPKMILLEVISNKSPAQLGGKTTWTTGIVLNKRVYKSVPRDNLGNSDHSNVLKNPCL